MPPTGSTASGNEVYRTTLAGAIKEFRVLAAELSKTEREFVRTRNVILALSNQLGVNVPADVLASTDKRTVAVRQAARRAVESSQSVDAVDPHAASTGNPTTRDEKRN